jgi:hypothetical protein
MVIHSTQYSIPANTMLQKRFLLYSIKYFSIYILKVLINSGKLICIQKHITGAKLINYAQLQCRTGDKMHIWKMIDALSSAFFFFS